MIIYNITLSVEKSIVPDWLSWMKNEHIPELMGTSLFMKAQINRVIVEDGDNETFAVAYTCLEMKDLHKYQAKFASKLQKKHVERYGDKVVAFRTIMEVIEEF